MPFSEDTIADRFNAAMRELGKVVPLMAEFEREACARLVEERAGAMRSESTVYHALMRTAELIRARQPD